MYVPDFECRFPVCIFIATDPLVGVLEFLGESAREAVLLVDGAADSGAVRELATESQRPQRAAAAASLRRTMAAVAAGGIGDGVE